MACSQPGGIDRAPHLDGDTARSQRLRWPDHRGYPSAKTRRPARCVASSTTSECPKNRSMFFAVFDPFPGTRGSAEHRQSFGIDPTAFGCTHELGHRARDHRYHLVELLRRVDVVRTKHATLSSAAIGARRRSPSIPSTSRSDRMLVDPATARGGHLPGGVAAWTGLPRVDVDGPSSCTCSGLLRPRHVVRGHGSRGAWAAPRRLQRRALFRRPFQMVG